MWNSVGRYTSHEIHSKVTYPEYDNCAMDGFAVNTSELNEVVAAKAGQDEALCVRVMGVSKAGDLHAPALPSSGCHKVMTGARFASGYDACLPVECVEYRDGYIYIPLSKFPLPERRHRRRRGEDFECGDVVAAKGTLVTRQRVLLLAQAGLDRITCKREVRIGIIQTGEEIVGGRSATTGYYLEAAFVRTFSSAVSVHRLDDVGDDLNKVATALDDAVRVQGFDVVCTTGGVSKGDFDFVPKAIQEPHGSIHYHGLALKPGKPQLFATMEEKAVFALPGNPMASAVGALSCRRIRRHVARPSVQL